jgi:peptide/nickel transport system permease protein
VKTYILKRLLLMIPTIVGITLLTYLIVRLAPGDPIEAMIRNQSGNIDPKAMKEDADKIRQRLGLVPYHYLRDWFFGAPPEEERPQPTGASSKVMDALDAVVSAGIGYGRWVGHLATGDFGESIKYRTSSGSRNPLALIAERIPVTATLNIIAEALIFFIAIPVGLAAARHQGKWFDRASSFVMLAFWSVPTVLAGTVLLGFLGKGGLGWSGFPIAGLHSFGYEKFSWGEYLADTLWHSVLPVVCLTYGGIAYLAKLGRASLLENLRADYVRTARAKGLPESRVVYHHALRNSLLPMITVMVLTLPGLIGGSVIVETIFSIQGTGLLLVNAAEAYDLALIMTETLLYGVLTLVFLLVGDLLYAWADPRVRYE